MTSLLVVPIKRSSDVNIGKPLKNLINSTYTTSPELKNEIDGNTTCLQQLRETALAKYDDASALTSTINYYRQLIKLEGRIDPSELQVTFKWKDAFDKGTLFGGRITLTLRSLAYEKLCVLFNVAALLSRSAADQSFDSDDGLQKALKHLQCSAGIFLYLKQNIVGAIHHEPTPDLLPATLNVLSELMLSQAQELVFLKAYKRSMKPGILAKLSSQCEEMYARVLDFMQKENLRSMWDTNWIPYVSHKQAFYNGMSQFQQSILCGEQKLVGEEICRLRYAKTLISAAIERSGEAGLCNASSLFRKIDAALVSAEKDNDFIYHERIPDVKSIASIEKAVVAKVSEMGTDGTLPSTMDVASDIDRDLFNGLMPVAVHKALNGLNIRKDNLQKSAIERLSEATKNLNNLLSSLNLPAALEDVSGIEIPRSLKDKSSSVVNAGGLAALERMLNDLPELKQRNMDLVDECDRMLKAERESDEQMKSQFKDKWNRTSSENLTKTFRQNIERYRGILANAVQADAHVKQKLADNRQGIAKLSSGPTTLQAPSLNTSGVKNEKSMSAKKTLIALMEKVETIKAERQVIESEVNSINLDESMKKILLSKLAQSPVIDEASVSTEALSKVFDPFTKQISESIERQEVLVAQIRSENQNFVGDNSGNVPRELLFKELAAAYDIFVELEKNLKEGTKFYNDLTQLLVTFQSKISDFCFARRAEKEELMKDLTSQMAVMDLSAPALPSVPSHHQTSSTSSYAKATPPPRPPPPADPYAGVPNPYNPYMGAPPATGCSSGLPYPTQPAPVYYPSQAPPPPGGYQYPNPQLYFYQTPNAGNPYYPYTPSQQ